MVSGHGLYETEILSQENMYNEFIMTALRTSAGVNLSLLEERFGNERHLYFLKNIKKFMESGHVNEEHDLYRLSPEGIFIADHIISEVML